METSPDRGGPAKQCGPRPVYNSAMGSPLDRAIATHRRSVVLHAWLSSVGIQVGTALFLAGGIVLFLRSRGMPLGPAWAWLAAPVLLGALVAGVLALRRRPSREITLAWIDLRCGGHGLLLAQDELSDPRWEQPAIWQMDRAGTPKQPAGSGRWIPVALALVFAVGALRVPLGPGEVQKPTPLLERTLANLMGRLGGLEAEGLLDEESRGQWLAALEQIEKRIPNSSSGAIFEALDRLTAEMDAETLGALDTNWLEEQALGVAMDLAGEDLGSAAGTFLAALESAADRGLPGTELMRSLAQDAALAGAERFLEGALGEASAGGLEELLEGGLSGEGIGVLREGLGSLIEGARGPGGAGLEEGLRDLLGEDGTGLMRMAEALARDLEGERSSLARIGGALGGARGLFGGRLGGEDLDPQALLAALGVGGAGSEMNTTEDPMKEFGEGEALDPRRFGPILLSEAWTELDPDALQQAVEEGRLSGNPGTGSPLASDPAIASNPGGEPIPQAGRATWKRRIPPRHRGAVRQFFGEPPP